MNNREWGAPAPRWLREADMYGGWYYRFNQDDYDMCKGLSFIIVNLHTREVVDELHKRGVRAVAYIQASTFPSISRRIEIIRNQPPEQDNDSYCYVQESPFWEILNLDNHLDWIYVDKRNQSYLERKSASCGGYEDDPPFEGIWVTDGKWDGWKNICPNAVGLPEAVITGIKALMDMGFDGIFCDSFEYTNRPQCRCWADEFGGHEHIDPKWNQEDAGQAMLKGIYVTVKSYGEDRIVILNRGIPDAKTLRYADAKMYESLFCTHVSTRRWHAFDKVKQDAEKKDVREALAAGKILLPLSYVGYTSHGTTEDAYYCYAAARILGMCWSDYFTIGDSPARVLYRTGLGGARSGILEHNGVNYRLFNKGVVALNPTSDDREIKIKTGFDFLRDLCTNRRYSPHDEVHGWTLETKELQAIIPAESGRVFISGFAR